MELNQFVENFAKQLENEEFVTITAETNFRNLEEWNSLLALSIIAMVDEEYSTKLTGDDIRSSNTIADLFEKVKFKNA